MLSTALAGAAALAAAGPAAAAAPLTVSSSNQTLVDGLGWAQGQALAWVQTGRAFETALVADAPAGATTVKVANVTLPGLTSNLSLGDTVTLDGETRHIAGPVDANGRFNGTAATNTTLVAPSAAGDASLHLASIAGLAAGHSLRLDGETATVAAPGAAAGQATTIVAPVTAGDTTVKVASLNGFVAGHQLVLDAGDGLEVASIASLGSAAGAQTTLAAPAAAGETSVKVNSVNGFVAGHQIVLDNTASTGTSVVTRTTLETATIAAVGSAGAGGTGITLSAPLAKAHDRGAGTRDAGTGIALSAPVARAHRAGVATRDIGTGTTLAAPLARDHAAATVVADPSASTGTGIALDAPLDAAHGAGAALKVPYVPSYWAGINSRAAFYTRDFAHQALGAHLLGLDAENKTMLEAFAATATASRKWYPLWSLTFAGHVYHTDFRSEASFVREIPETFELTEKAAEQYRWTGDRTYVDDPALKDYYANSVGPFVTAHDPDADGVAGETGSGDIFTGVTSFNENGEKLLESGDAIGSQYRALLAAAELGDGTAAQRAADLRAYFETHWWSDAAGRYIRGFNAAGPLTDFGKENSWFMPMKGITAPGARTDAYLDFIDQSVSALLPFNIEAYTYLPDVFFPYGRDETAWKWMKYTLASRAPYPEVSYTAISQTVAGLLGVDADAPAGRVATLSHLPSEVGWLKVGGIPVGAHKVAVRQDGAGSTTFTHESGTGALSWRATFAGDHPWVQVDGLPRRTTAATQNGRAISYVDVGVAPGATATVAVAAATEASAGVGGTVPATLALAVGPASFGVFTPGVAQVYETTAAATVTSTAGDAALTVADPGHLTNGAFALPQPLQVTGLPRSWSGPASNDPVTIGLRQPIGAGDALRTGAYSTTLVFTLSTTSP
jgi:hypothetical protein